MVAKLEITLGYQKEDNHDHLYNVQTFERFEDRLICSHEGLTKRGFLFIRFNSASINFKILPEDFDPMKTEPIVECDFKLSKIAEETRNYLRVLENRKSNGLASDIQYDEARSKIHQILSMPIDTKLGEHKIEYLSDTKPTKFSRKLISAWFKQIAFCENLGVSEAPKSIGSFSHFLHRQSLT